MIRGHQLLILYRHDAAKADELRWCLRSLSNVDGCYQVPLVVGDPPEWYTGPVLRMEPQGGRRTDVRNKLREIIASDRVANQFCLLADDNVIVRPIDFESLLIPRVQPPRTEDGKGWQSLRFATAEFCRSRGWPVVDASTHWPYGWEKGKLLETLDLIEDHPANLLVESVYASMHGQPTIDARLDFRYAWRGNGWCEDAVVISHRDNSFLGGLRNEIQRLFPDPSPWESGPVPEVRTIGRLSAQAQHACRSLGDMVRVAGNLPIYRCDRHGECGPFGGAPLSCEGCPDYDPNDGRMIRIGGSKAVVTGVAARRCRK